MPPKTKKRPSAVEEYESDGGFVANDDGDDRPKTKKTKTSKSGSTTKALSKVSTKTSKSVVGGGSVAANGEEFWEVSSP